MKLTLYISFVLLAAFCGQGVTVVHYFDASNCQHGQITTPEWGGLYPSNTMEAYIITGDPGTHIILLFKHYHVDCSDIFKIYDDGVLNFVSSIACGHEPTEMDPRMLGNNVTIEFQTDESEEASGFRIQYSIHCDECPGIGDCELSGRAECETFGGCGVGYFSHKFRCGTDTIQCVDDCYECRDGATPPMCSSVIDYSTCQKERFETGCSQRYGVGTMIQRYLCSGYGLKICVVPCCCYSFVGRDPNNIPLLTCQSTGVVRVTENHITNCLPYKIEFIPNRVM